MLRRLQNIVGKNIDGQFAAEVVMKRGLLVQKDGTTKKIVLPTSQEGLFWLDADKQPTGLMAYEGEISDYDTRLDTIQVGEFGQLEKPVSGERYATTEYVEAGLVVDGYVAVETTVGADQGKIIHSATATPMVYRGLHNDNGNQLAIIEVL